MASPFIYSERLSTLLNELRQFEITCHVADEISDSACYFGEDVKSDDATDIFTNGFELACKMDQFAKLGEHVFYGIDEMAQVAYYFIGKNEDEIVAILKQYAEASYMNEDLEVGTPNSTLNLGED